MSLPPDYVELLDRIAGAFDDYRSSTGNHAVLVGGAAVAIYTDGDFMSGDFDVVASMDAEFIRSLERLGFIREDGEYHLRGGFYHPEFQRYGLELVSGSLFDGRSQGPLMQLTTRSASLFLPRIEDLIADRLGQHAVASPSDLSRLMQARRLYALATGLDLDYLRRRIVEETGDPTLLPLSSKETN